MPNQKTTGAKDPAADGSALLATSAIILAGGLGTRLRSVVSDRPKVMAQVHGRPFLEYLLDQIGNGGFTSAILCVGHLAEQVEQHFGTSYRNLKITYSRETKLLGTAGAIRFALPLIGTGASLVMNGDSYCDIDVGEFRKWHAQHGSRLSIALTQVEDTSRYGQVAVDDDFNVVGFLEKARSSGAGLVNAGIYLIDRKVIEAIPPDNVVSLERDVFPAQIGNHFRAWTAPHRIFIDIGTPQSYNSAQTLF